MTKSNSTINQLAEIKISQYFIKVNCLQRKILCRKQLAETLFSFKKCFFKSFSFCFLGLFLCGLNPIKAQLGVLTGSGMATCAEYSFSICPNQTITPLNYMTEHFVCNGQSTISVAFVNQGNGWRVAEHSWRFVATGSSAIISGIGTNLLPTSLTFNQGLTLSPINYFTSGGNSYVTFQVNTTPFPTQITLNKTNFNISLTATNGGGGPIGVSTTNYSYCNNSTSGVNICASVTTPGGPFTFNWQPGNLSGQCVFVSPSATTIYTVTVTSGCAIGIATLQVAVTENCCLEPTVGMQTLTTLSGNYNGGTYVIMNNITLSGNTDLTGVEFLLGPNVKITVPQPFNLNIDGSHLYACGIRMWDGIDVLDGGYISTNPATGAWPDPVLIEDAKIAVNLSNISPAHHSPPIDMKNTIFNKNHIGVKISNAPFPVTNLPIGLYDCVFTSRNLPYTSTTWPSADVNAPGLRFATIPANGIGLNAPYLLNNYSVANLKSPYANQSAQFGIQIQNVGETTGTIPTSGVDGVEIGVTYPPSATSNVDFNLFDNLGVGIDITDASFITMNNVFQNMVFLHNNPAMTGTGIEHRISANSIFNMNAQLDLRPVGAGRQSTAYGNRFWNCYTGVHTKDIFSVKSDYGIFRSEHLPNPLLPYTGIFLESNRFDYDIKYGEFNNLEYGIKIVNSAGSYDMGGGHVNNSIYAGNITLEQNYFGAHINSTNSLNNGEYFGDAIHLDGPNAPVYQIISGGSANIRSNKINRAFRGISLNSMFDYPVTISGNEIFLLDDFTFATWQYGIEAHDNSGNLVITDNSLSSVSTNNAASTNMSLVYSRNNLGFNSNLGTGSPIVNCNKTSMSYKGFEFEGDNRNASWMGNIMFKHYYGYVLTANGVIGQQGAPFINSSDNQWSGTSWNGTNSFQTWCDNSDADFSPLYIKPGTITNPVFNGGTGSFNPYVNSLTSINLILDTKSQRFRCTSVSYPPLPSQRMSNSLGISSIENESINSDWNVEVYPNPSNGIMYVMSTVENENLSISIIDLTGKEVYSKIVWGHKNNTIDVSSLKASMYFIEVRNDENKVIRKKLIIE